MRALSFALVNLFTNTVAPGHAYHRRTGRNVALNELSVINAQSRTPEIHAGCRNRKKCLKSIAKVRVHMPWFEKCNNHALIQLMIIKS